MKWLLIISSFLLLPIVLFAQVDSRVAKAQLDNDINALLELTKVENKDVREQARKALLTTTNYDGLGYDVASSYYEKSHDSGVETLFSQIYENKKEVEINSFRNKNIAEINQYYNQSAAKAELVRELLYYTIYAHKDELSLQDLNYICAELPEYYNTEFNTERSTRIPEIQTTLKNNVSKYVDEESKFIRNFDYIIEKSAYEYLYECYQHIAKAYSTVSQVPGDVNNIEAQYRAIVNKIFSGEKYRSYLQNEVDKFCAQVNNSRNVYSVASGKPEYEKLSLKVPKVTFFNYSANDSSLVRIVAEKEDYKSTRETVEVVADVAGFIGNLFSFGLGGDLATTAVKTIANAYFSSEMIDNISNARRNYMQTVLKTLEDTVWSQTKFVEDDLRTQLIENEKRYKDYVER